MIKRHPEPFLWLLFSGGGVVAALLMPMFLLLFGLVFPLGWIAAPDYARLSALFGHPLTRIVLFVACGFSLVHAAHRFRYTLYDGLQIKHLNEYIAVLCYGGAIVGTLAAAYVLL
jgi:succinate dehydrogenase subunit D